MNMQTLGVLLILIIGSTCLVKAQNQKPLVFDYDWMKDKPTLLQEKELSKVDFRSKSYKPDLWENQEHVSLPNGQKNQHRYTLRIAVPNTENVVKMPVMKIDTLMHYHLRYKDIE